MGPAGRGRAAGRGPDPALDTHRRGLGGVGSGGWAVGRTSDRATSRPAPTPGIGHRNATAPQPSAGPAGLVLAPGPIVAALHPPQRARRHRQGGPAATGLQGNSAPPGAGVDRNRGQPARTLTHPPTGNPLLRGISDLRRPGLLQPVRIAYGLRGGSRVVLAAAVPPWVLPTSLGVDAVTRFVRLSARGRRS